MKLAIMQPYFLPYIGYFQLIAAVDVFVLYDNIKYTKKGWINRNRILRNGTDVVFSLPLKKDSDECHVVQRELAGSFDRQKLLNQIKGAYEKAPFFDSVFPLFERVVNFQSVNLFDYIYYSVCELCKFVDLSTKILISSTVDVDHDLKSQDKVLAICNALNADMYINAIGGVELYQKDVFSKRGIELKFIKSLPFEYSQFGNDFVPWLSMVDVLMFNSKEATKHYLLGGYELV